MRRSLSPAVAVGTATRPRQPVATTAFTISRMTGMDMFDSRECERGAIIIHVAFALLALLAFSAFVVDMGVMWVSRRQAQNAADAGALAGAVALMRDGARTPRPQNRLFSGRMTTPSSVPRTLPRTCASRSLARRRERAAHHVTSRPLRRVSTSQAAFVRTCFAMRLTGRIAAARRWVQRSRPCLAPSSASRSSACARRRPRKSHRATRLDASCPLQPSIAGPTTTTRIQIRPTSPTIRRQAQRGGRRTICTSPRRGTCIPPPYNGNTNHTGWKVTNDFGRQMVLKDGGVGTYSAGWALQVDLPDSTGSQDYKWNIQHCNQQAVGIAAQPEACSTVDEPIGCVSVKTGVAQGPTSQGIGDVAKGLVGQDPAAHWDSTQQTVLGGGGLSSPRVRPMVVLDIDNYVGQGCSGTTCIGKVANIIGFFVEGMCKDVTLDPGIGCDDPTKDVVGRIVTVPGSYVSGTGDVEESASFVKVVRLVR